MELNDQIEGLKARLTGELNAVNTVQRLLADANLRPTAEFTMAPYGLSVPLPMERTKRKYAKRALALPEAEVPILKRLGTTPHGATAAEAKPRVTIGARILASLKIRPMSSGEVFEFMQNKGWYTGELAGVYTECSRMKGLGTIESFTDDEGDGTRRYRLPSA